MTFARFPHILRRVWLPGLVTVAAVSLHTRLQADEPVSRDELWRRIEPYFEPPPEFAGDFGPYRSPLKFADGGIVKSAEDWARRRKEILEVWHRRLGSWPALVE